MLVTVNGSTNLSSAIQEGFSNGTFHNADYGYVLIRNESGNTVEYSTGATAAETMGNGTQIKDSETLTITNATRNLWLNSSVSSDVQVSLI